MTRIRQLIEASSAIGFLGSIGSLEIESSSG